MKLPNLLRLRHALGSKHHDVNVSIEDRVDSTNLRLKERARSGAVVAPALLLADSQSAGRGRLGRCFVSPSGTGLYMSLLVRPECGGAANRITILAAVAACQAIEELTPLHPQIKWVNDLFVNGKKVCGILAEGLGDQVVVGFGVNLRTPEGGFPPEAGIAGALDLPVSRSQLAGRIAAYFLDGLNNLDDPDILNQYRQRMPLVGRDISFLQDGQTKHAHVVGVDDDGGLLLQTPQGPQVLRCGEVSLGSYSFLGLE